MIFSIILMSLYIIFFTAIYTLLYPMIIPLDMLPTAYFVTFTLVNILAIILSWIYFDKTKCYQDEGNPIAMILYYLYGHNIAHIILIIFRIFLNINYYFSVYGISMTIFGIEINIFPKDPFFLSLPIAIFTVELLFNIHSLISNSDIKCNPPKPIFCLDPTECEI